MSWMFHLCYILLSDTNIIFIVIQNKDNYKVKVQLPGIKKDNIEVELDNDFMTICAQTHEEKEEETQDEE